MIKLSVTVVVPAYNCEKTIFKTITAILNQTYPPSKIIVVDDGSIDRTPAIIKSFLNIFYIRQDNAGPASARNKGAEHSMTDLVFFTDSDCVPQKDWLEQSIKHFVDPKVGAVAGSYGIANKESLLARCIHDEIIFRHENLLKENVKVFGSYNVGIRKILFDQLGGFDKEYRFASGEDNDLSYKIIKAGYQIRFEKNSRVDHYHTTKIIKYLREQFRHGFWRVKMYADHPQMIKGDDYTFWKDALEVPLALLICGFLILSMNNISLGLAFLFSLVAITLLIELIFSFYITKNLFLTIFFAFVMFWRAFARTFGFSAGFLCFLPKINFKKLN